jgi:hypothetical protein
MTPELFKHVHTVVQMQQDVLPSNLCKKSLSVQAAASCSEVSLLLASVRVTPLHTVILGLSKQQQG